MRHPTLPAEFEARIGTLPVRLPVVEVAPDLAVALFMTIDHGVELIAGACRELADRVRGLAPDVVAGPATLGIPVAIETSRALGLDDYVILQKTPKVHLGDALAVEAESITTAARQRLLLDRRRVGALAGRRVLLVDDVVSTGGSLAAALPLLDRAGADVVGVGALLAEGTGWRARLGPRADLVHTLGTIPLFRRDTDGSWCEDPS